MPGIWQSVIVAPYIGAWIEIGNEGRLCHLMVVTPHIGELIEI
ncbi:hypothetical protein [Bacillus cereus]|nr:hypothetical protein [Bacillus cereus]